MLCGPLFLGPGAVRMHLDAGAVEAEAVEVLVRQLLVPQRGEQPRKHARLGPAAQPHVDRVPLAVALRKGAPLAAVLKDMQQGVDDDDVRNPHVAALDRQMGMQQSVLFFGDVGHDWELLVCFFFLDRRLPQTRS